MYRLRFLLLTVMLLAAARPTGGSAQTAGLGSTPSQYLPELAEVRAGAKSSQASR
jgi:hypothetical protein